MTLCDVGIRDQPNFTRGANFLLSWDVPLQVDLLVWQQRMEALQAAKTTLTQRRPKKPGVYWSLRPVVVASASDEACNAVLYF